MLIGWLLFVAGGGLFVYTFVGYPLALRLAARGERGWTSPPRPDESDLPSLSITVPVYNEAHQIEQLLESLVALEYPEDRRQILIVSDGSDDGTDPIVRRWASRGVELLRIEGRVGKGAAENAAREHLTGDIVVNTDASIRIRPDALKALVRPFADPSVGVVSGRDVSVGEAAGDANAGEAGYVDYEMGVRVLETRAGGIVGASGCLYATRRALHLVEVPPQLSRDFAAALVARDHGYRAVSAPEAVCFVPRASSLEREHRRKVRTVARGMATLWSWRHLVDPRHEAHFAWKLFSHKVCRWLVPPSLLAVLGGVALVGLSTPPGVGQFGGLVTLAAAGTLAAASAGVLAGAWGWHLASRDEDIPRILAVPAFFLMSNLAVVQAFGRVLLLGSERSWEPTRREASSG